MLRLNKTFEVSAHRTFLQSPYQNFLLIFGNKEVYAKITTAMITLRKEFCESLYQTQNISINQWITECHTDKPLKLVQPISEIQFFIGA